MGNILTARCDQMALGAVNCCEDCPLENLFPPDESDCPYFVNTGGFPECIQRRPREQEIPVHIGQICISEVAVTIRNARNADLV